MSESRVGDEFGPYRLDELLGRGGMGEVYRAYDTVRDREVALKLLNPGLAGDDVYQERFRRESRAIARLGEPHIIPIHDFGDIDGVLYLDMRLVVGRDLRKMLTADGALPVERAVTVLGQIAEALDAAHSDGLVHRDVKPENILITDADFAYLVDFGIAQQDSSTHLTQTGSTIGSFAYMAPEQFDNAPASPASDIYALTAVFFEMLTGRVPHPAGTVSSAIKAALLNPTPTLRSLNTDLPEGLEPVIARGLAKEPADRYGSAVELANAARSAIGVPTAVAPGETTVIGPSALGAYDDTVYGTPAYSPTMVRPSGPVPLDAGYVSAPQPGYVSAPQPGYVSAPFPGPMYAQPAPRRGGGALIPTLIAAGVFLLVVLGGIIFYVLRSSGNDATTAGPSTVTQTVVSSTTTAAPAPPSTPCDSTVGIGTDVTSCPFAFAVRDEYLRTGAKGQSRRIVAFSPVTGSSYPMACNPESAAVVCRGGDNAVVVIY